MRLLDRYPLERVSFNLGLVLVLAIVLFTVTVVVPALQFDVPQVGIGSEARRATVNRVLEESTQTTSRGRQFQQRVELELTNRTVIIDHAYGEQDSRRLNLSAGDEVLVSSVGDPDVDEVYVVDYARGPQLTMFALAFAALVILVGRWQGLTSIIAMALSLLVILRFIVPGIVSGHNPVTISIVGALVIMLTSLYLSHGINRKTTTAVAGTAIALTLTAGLASFALEFARLSGLAEEEAATLNIVTEGGINPQGLLLAGIIIGALGVLDDVTVAQASAVFELRSANPLLRARDLFRRAMNIGRDHIASTVNTLFLAYAGAALPLLILLSLQTEPTGTVVSREFLATEVIRTLVGSIGIVASVPLTTALAALSTRLNVDR